MTSRIVWTLLIEVLVFVVTIILAMVDSSEWPGVFFYLTIGCVILLNSKWYFVSKNFLTYCEKKCSSDREKLLKFEVEGRGNKTILKVMGPEIKIFYYQGPFFQYYYLPSISCSFVCLIKRSVCSLFDCKLCTCDP